MPCLSDWCSVLWYDLFRFSSEVSYKLNWHSSCVRPLTECSCMLCLLNRLKFQRERVANLYMQKQQTLELTPERLLKDLIWIGIRLLRLRILMSMMKQKSLQLWFVSYALSKNFRHPFIYRRFQINVHVINGFMLLSF